MIGYLIKNNLKLMLRNKLVVIFMLLAPLFTIALLSSAFENMMKQYEMPKNLQQEIVGKDSNNSFDGQTETPSVSNIELPTTQLDFMPYVEASDYYGIIYVVYYSWCGIICIAGVLASEKKNAINRKFLVSPITEFRLFLAKWISAALVAIFEMTVVALISTWIFDITWGNVWASLGIILLTIIAANAYGLFLFYLFGNLAISVGVLFTTVWFMGFVGGSFETYMFSVIPDKIKNISPIYHVNRALVEYSCMGKSEYGTSAVFFLISILLVSILGAVLAQKLRREVRAVA